MSRELTGLAILYGGVIALSGGGTLLLATRQWGRVLILLLDIMVVVSAVAFAALCAWLYRPEFLFAVGTEIVIDFVKLGDGAHALIIGSAVGTVVAQLIAQRWRLGDRK